MVAETVSLGELGAIFFGAFLDATLGFCFFVFGEAYFLMAGALLYTTSAISPVLAALAGAYSADQFGYFLGARFRRVFRGFMLVRARRRLLLRRGKGLLDRRGMMIIAVSRLMGPVAWVMPALVGSMGLSYRRFAMGSAVGVIMGVGLFVTMGWYGALIADDNGFDIKAFAARHFWALLFAGQFGFLASAYIAQYVSRRVLSRK